MKKAPNNQEIKFEKSLEKSKNQTRLSLAFRTKSLELAMAGIPAHKAHPHVLKHSLAMHTIPHAGIENVRQYLGHKSLSSTGAYLRVSDEDASAAIVNALGRKRRPRHG